MNEKLKLRIFALEKALELVKRGVINITDGTHNLFQFAEELHSFVVQNNDKFGIKSNPRPVPYEVRETEDLEEVKKAETALANEAFLKEVLKQIFN